MRNTYQDLLARKRISFQPRGFDPPDLHPSLKPFQRAVTEFSIATGASAMFLDTGLGKSFSGLEWGRAVMEHTIKPVLMLAPLAVGPQHQREAERWGIDARYVRDKDGMDGTRIYVTNYERLDNFTLTDFAGIILDESSVLKSFTGITTRKLISAFSTMPYRLCCTATPAPNDHTELGTHSEFLGVMRRDEMLPRWFINDTADTGRWHVKGHARSDFWRWVASWARCVSLPSDLGFDDAGYVLPPITVTEHMVKADRSIDPGEELRGKFKGQNRLFRIPETSATSIHKEKRLTTTERAKLAANVVYEDWACGSQSTDSIVESAVAGMRRIERAETLKATDPIQSSAESIISNGLPPTKSASPNIDAPMLMSEMRVDASDTQKIINFEKPERPKRGRRTKQKNGMADSSQASASQLLSTTPYSNGRAASAPSADLDHPISEDTGSPLTTATPPGASEDYSALDATKGLENSETTPRYSGGLLPTSERDFWVIWCDSDYEQDAIEAEFGDDAISIKGSMSMATKERLHEEWLRGERKLLICKPVMFGYGVD